MPLYTHALVYTCPCGPLCALQRLVANCDMGQDAPTDVWDWHIYTNPTGECAVA